MWREAIHIIWTKKVSVLIINIAMVKGNHGRGQFILFLQPVFANNQIHSGYNALKQKVQVQVNQNSKTNKE